MSAVIARYPYHRYRKQSVRRTDLPWSWKRRVATSWRDSWPWQRQQQQQQQQQPPARCRRRRSLIRRHSRCCRHRRRRIIRIRPSTRPYIRTLIRRLRHRFIRITGRRRIRSLHGNIMRRRPPPRQLPSTHRHLTRKFSSSFTSNDSCNMRMCSTINASSKNK